MGPEHTLDCMIWLVEGATHMWCANTRNLGGASVASELLPLDWAAELRVQEVGCPQSPEP